MSVSDGPAKVEDALPPFDRSALDHGADVILRSSDLVDFYTVKALLTITSPDSLFGGLFSKGSIPDVTKDDLPVVVLTEEPSKMIDLLLRIATPGPDPMFKTNKDLLDMCIMADKYALEGIFGRLQQLVAHSGLIKEKPLICYAIGARLGWKGVCEEAVPYSLALGWEELLEPDDIMDTLHPKHLQALWRYRMSCIKRNQEIVGFDEKALIHRESISLPDFTPTSWLETSHYNASNMYGKRTDCHQELARFQGRSGSVHTWVRVFLSHLALQVLNGTIPSPDLKPRITAALEACRSRDFFRCHHNPPSSLDVELFVQKLETKLRDVPKFEFKP